MHDVERLVTGFYNKVRQDDQLAQHFASIDWDHHTPLIVSFWCMILLGTEGYKGNPMAKHLSINLVKADFERWLQLFTTTVDELFEGEKANEAKQRAFSIAAMFQFKMGIIK
jgi:hemoglobin